MAWFFLDSQETRILWHDPFHFGGRREKWREKSPSGERKKIHLHVVTLELIRVTHFEVCRWLMTSLLPSPIPLPRPHDLIPGITGKLVLLQSSHERRGKRESSQHHVQHSDIFRRNGQMVGSYWGVGWLGLELSLWQNQQPRNSNAFLWRWQAPEVGCECQRLHRRGIRRVWRRFRIHRQW